MGLAPVAWEGVDDDPLSTDLASIIGLTATFAVAGGLFLLLRQVQRRRSTSTARPAQG